MSALTFSDLMALDRAGPDAFRTRPRAGPPRLFGGLVAALALSAATATVGSDRHPHSVHCSFIGPGRPDEPVDLTVHRALDGRSFTNRQVAACQDGRDILTLTASFHVDEPGADVPAPVPVGVPGPDDVAPIDPSADIGTPVWGTEFDVRLLPIPTVVTPLVPAIRFWARSRAGLPEDPLLGACVVVYVTDMHSARAAALVTGEAVLAGPLTSLDHAVWLHRPVGPNEWLLVEVRPLSTGSARGLVVGTVHSLTGRHVASFAQEVLVRRPAGLPPTGERRGSGPAPPAGPG